MGDELQGPCTMDFCQHRESRSLNFVPDFYCICIYVLLLYLRNIRRRDRVYTMHVTTDVCTAGSGKSSWLHGRLAEGHVEVQCPFSATILYLQRYRHNPRIYHLRICRVWQGNIIARKNARLMMRKFEYRTWTPFSSQLCWIIFNYVISRHLSRPTRRGFSL